MLIIVFVQYLLARSVAGSSPKRGVALAQGGEPDLGKAGGGQCSWLYNWSPAPPASVPSGLTFTPMQWGRDNAQGFADAVRKTGAKTILVRCVALSVEFYGMLACRASMNQICPHRSRTYQQRRRLRCGKTPFSR